jgi:hypothetical protein
LAGQKKLHIYPFSLCVFNCRRSHLLNLTEIHFDV